jgi:hypothetical protein
VLDHAEHGHGVEALAFLRDLRQGGGAGRDASRQRARDALRGALQPQHLPAPGAGLIQDFPAPEADLQQAPPRAARQAEALDLVHAPAGCLALEWLRGLHREGGLLEEGIVGQDAVVVVGVEGVEEGRLRAWVEPHHAVARAAYRSEGVTVEPKALHGLRVTPATQDARGVLHVERGHPGYGGLEHQRQLRLVRLPVHRGTDATARAGPGPAV